MLLNVQEIMIRFSTTASLNNFFEILGRIIYHQMIFLERWINHLSNKQTNKQKLTFLGMLNDDIFASGLLASFQRFTEEHFFKAQLLLK